MSEGGADCLGGHITIKELEQSPHNAWAWVVCTAGKQEIRCFVVGLPDSSVFSVWPNGVFSYPNHKAVPSAEDRISTFLMQLK